MRGLEKKIDPYKYPFSNAGTAAISLLSSNLPVATMAGRRRNGFTVGRASS
jgi:hypothetical protein